MDAEFLHELFASFRPVSVRRLFGGAGIYADGVMFALVSDGAIYLKVDETGEPAFESENLPPFTYDASSGKRAIMSYRRMPDRLYDDPDELSQWAARALDAAKDTAKRKKTPRARAAVTMPKAKATSRRLTKR